MNEWLLIIITILVSGFFSGSEIAFVSANRLKLEIITRQNTLISRYVDFFFRRPETFLITTLVGNNITNVLYATLMTIYLDAPIVALHEYLFGSAPAPVTVLIAQTTIASLVIMYFGEIIPKAVFRTHADVLISVIALPLRIIHLVMRPFIWMADVSSRTLLNLFKSGNGDVQQLFGRQDIETILREVSDDITEASEIDRDDTEILTNVLELSNKRVKESMVPRTEIVAVAKDASIEEVLKSFVSSGFSKLPVYDDTIDNIIGSIQAYDLYAMPKSIEEVMRPVMLVPQSKKAKDLLAEFRKSKMSMAVVLDEYGGTSGLVTIEDLLEEVVGDIMDEFDIDDHIMKKLNNNSYVFSGAVDLEDLEEKFPEIQILHQNDEDEFETVAGYIIYHTGRIPKVNEEIVIRNHKFIISKATPSRIETVKLVLLNS